MRASRAVVTTVAVAAVLVTTACTSSAPTPATSSPTPTPSASTTAPSSSPPAPDRLVLGAVGPAGEEHAFRATVNAWNADASHVDLQLRRWSTAEGLRRSLEAGAEVPDVFMASRHDLAWLLDNHLIQPVDELLDERGVEFGDNYYRDALEAFSAEDHLQCLPYAVSPAVVYYNKRLVNFTKMTRRGLDAPDPENPTGWSFDQFAAAAKFASKPRRGSKGVHVDATLEGLAPFITSGGGDVFDDPDQPTTLSFSSDGSRAALERTLELLRNPQVTLDESQLARASALRWFLRGKLGMIVGDRSLAPVLRDHDLDFDVLPMPRLDGAATTGDVTGLCMSATTASAGLSADVIVHEISAESLGQVVRAGYLQPANVAVALSDDFLQPGRPPEHSGLFNSSVRSMAVSPLIDTLPLLERTIAPSLQQLVYGTGALDLESVTAQIDAASVPILDPEAATASPSGSPSASGSASPSDTDSP